MPRTPTKIKIVDNSDKVKVELHNIMLKRITEAVLVTQGNIKMLVSSKGSGQLRDSIDYKVEEQGSKIIGGLGSPLEHAIYNEFGTGEFAENGKGRKGYWVYVKGSNGKIKAKDPNKRYTLAQAKFVVKLMREKGLDAYYTKGMKPKKFMRNGFKNSKAVVKKIIGEPIK